MHFLQINKFYWLKGGSESAYFALCELLKKHGHTILPFSMKDPRNIPSQYERFFVENVDYSQRGLMAKLSAAMKIIYSLEARKKMRELLCEFQPDIAHFHIFQHQISPSVFGQLWKHNIPIVLTLHDLKPMCPNYKMLNAKGICERCKGRKFYNCFMHRCSKGSRLNSLVNTIEMYFHYVRGYYQAVDKFIAVSKFYRDKMIEFGFPEDKVIHIPNFLDCTKFTLSDSDRGYGVYFGRFSEEKGVMTLLKALQKTSDKPFLIIGNGPLDQVIRQKANELNLKNITFTGFKSGEELKKLIRESSFTVIPSEWYENCPMSILESFALGKPVVGSRIGGIPELISEGVDGLTFEAWNSDDLAEKMNFLWSNPDKRKIMGKNGRNKVESDYSPNIHYQKIMMLYSQVCH